MDDKKTTREPSAYSYLRELKASGYVSCANAAGEVMASATEPILDDLADSAQDLFHSVVFDRDRVDLAAQH